MESLRREAVVDARAGRFDPALAKLRRVVDAAGNSNGAMWDYITVLSWAGKHSEAVSRYEAWPDKNDVPDSVIRAVAKSQRDLRHHLQALELYHVLLSRQAGDADALRGAVLTLADSGRQDEAMALLSAFRARFPEDAGLAHVVAQLYLQHGDPLRALQLYDWILSRTPGDGIAMNIKVLAMSDMGAPIEALAYAETNAPAITAETRLTLDCNLATARMAWGETAAAVTLLDRIIAGETRPMSHLRARFDRMIALHTLNKMRMVLQAYTNMTGQGVTTPPWIDSVAASAYLRLGDPKRAGELYRAAVKARPDDFDAWFGLYAVHVERGEYKEAEEVLVHLKEVTAAWPTRRGNWHYNWDRQSVELAQASCLAYQNRLVEAQIAFERLLVRAPANLGARAGLAQVEAWRGWPRQALESFDCVITAGRLDPLPRPDHVPSRELSARNGRTEVMNDIYLKDEARDYGRMLLERNPDNLHTRRVNRRMELEDSTRLLLDSFHTTEDEGGSETMLHVRLAQPVTSLLSVHGAYLYRSNADSPERTPTAEIHRVYGGTTWTLVPPLTVTAELSGDLEESGTAGAMAQLRWRMSDRWSADAGHDTYSLDVPLRARAEGVTGKKTEGALAYRHSELTTVRMVGQFQELADGNDHAWYGILGEQGLYTRAYVQSRLLAEVSVSENSRTDVSYFSPDHDLTFLLTHQLDHTLYRQNERAWMHRLFVSIGEYKQPGFGAKTIRGARYEQDYNFADDFALLWGLGYGRRYYDGEPTDATDLYLTLRKIF